MPFPKTFLRGLITKGSVTDERYVTAEAFQFQDFRSQRSDNYNELSINWEDSDEAVEVLLAQKKDGTDEPQFKVGFVRMPLLKVRNLLKAHVKDKSFAYERRPVDGNPFHGNLLADAKLSNQIKKNLQHSLATLATASELYLRSDAEVPYLIDKKKNMPKVSIIVPVYKVEQYIRECLDSIKAQTFMDWECLLIDDGSPDNSGKICDEYAQEDARFKVFHVENGGVSRARNIGLDNMIGEWVMFVDSDDAIAANALKTCLGLVEHEHLDMLQFSFSRDKSDMGKHDGVKTEVVNLNGFIEARTLLVCIAGSFLKTSILRSNNLWFDSSLKLAEDQLFLFSYMNKAERLQKIDDILYWYRVNENSATHNSKTEDMTNSIQHLVNFKNTSSHWSMYIDRINVVFLIKIILNRDIGALKLKELIEGANLKDLRLIDPGLPTLFCKVNSFSRLLAILVVRLRGLTLKN